MYCDLKSYGQTFVRLNWFIITAEPPETEHQLCKDLVMTYGRWTFTRIKQQGSCPESSKHTCIRNMYEQKSKTISLEF